MRGEKKWHVMWCILRNELMQFRSCVVHLIGVFLIEYILYKFPAGKIASALKNGHNHLMIPAAVHTELIYYHKSIVR